MKIVLQLLLIGSILSLNLLMLIAIKYMISVTNWIKNLVDNSKDEYEAISQIHNPKRGAVGLKAKVKGSNLVYLNSYFKV